MTTNPTPTDPSTDDEVRCQRCRNFFITHDVKFPYGCRALGFKSRKPPAAEVLAASGMPCAYFAAKPQNPR